MIGTGGGGGNHNATALLLQQAQAVANKMTSDEHAAIVDAETRLAMLIERTLAAVAQRP